MTDADNPGFISRVANDCQDALEESQICLPIEHVGEFSDLINKSTKLCSQ